MTSLSTETFPADVPPPPELDRQIAPVVALPRPLTSLVGRDREVAAARTFLLDPTCRLLTLTGPGGVGKTRLAVRVAASLSNHFADGVVFVPLAAVARADLVLPTIAQAFGLRDLPDQSLSERLAAALHDRQQLLVLDNLEHLIAATPDLASLLASCPALHILATSRTRLRLSGEQEYPVPPLPAPPDQPSPSAATVTGSPAVALFVERARAANPAFALTDANAPAVAALCRRLDGLPLAIELAAARTRVLSPTALVAGLERRLPLLTGGPRDLPTRLQTMANAVAWSYDLLSPEERTLFRRLAVFVGSFTLDAAEAVGGDGQTDRRTDGTGGASLSVSPSVRLSVLDRIAALIDGSLLQQEETAADGGLGAVRFGMLETIREFGWVQLAAEDDPVEIRRRHAGHFMELAVAAGEALSGGEQGTWLQRLDADHDNLRAALGWLLDRQEDESALRLASALWRYWEIRGHLREGSAWLERALAIGAGAPAALRASALNGLGNLLSYLGDPAQAQSAYEASLSLRRDLADPQGIADSLNNLGLLATDSGDYARARSLHDESLALRRELGDRRGLALSLNNLGDLALAEGDVQRAWDLHQEALAVRRDLRDLRGVAYSHNNLGAVAARRDDPAAARPLLDDALALFRRLGDKAGLAEAQANLGRVALSQGEPRQAAAALSTALALRADFGDLRGVAECLEGLAAIDDARLPAPPRVRLLGAAATLRTAIGIPIQAVDRPRLERTLEVLRRRLDRDAFTAAFDGGRLLATEQAITEATQLADAIDRLADRDATDHGPTESTLLTPREIEVLHLLAEGRSDREIADALFLSPRTVSSHVGHILAKLDVPSRAAAIAIALRQRLV
ncbi:MAG TPA: tetratricopeptide repeat protein [Thermomicrobiales bacterium]